jgi:hypothetical protein
MIILPFAACAAAVVTRHDRLSPFTKETQLFQFTPSVSTSKIGSNGSAIRTSTNARKADTAPFVFTFNCTGITPATCENAKYGFAKAGDLIAASLTVKVPIKVYVNFRSFCGAVNGTVPANCKFKDILGQASGASFFPARTSNEGPISFFPQSLVKQLKSDVALEFTPYDIIAEFNADYPFYFSNLNTTITPTQIDFVFVVAHELTHGLGFDTQWVDLSLIYPSITKDNSYLASPIFTGGTSPDKAVASYFQPLNVFDNVQKTNSACN